MINRSPDGKPDTDTDTVRISLFWLTRQAVHWLTVTKKTNGLTMPVTYVVTEDRTLDNGEDQGLLHDSRKPIADIS